MRLEDIKKIMDLILSRGHKTQVHPGLVLALFRSYNPTSLVCDLGIWALFSNWPNSERIIPVGKFDFPSLNWQTSEQLVLSEFSPLFPDCAPHHCSN